MKPSSFILLFMGSILSGLSHGVTLCVSACSPDIGDSEPPILNVGDPLPETDYLNQVYVSGNLYLDFSLWGNVGGIDASQGNSYSFQASKIALLSETQDPPNVSSFEAIFIEEPFVQLGLLGNIILFSDNLIGSTSFTATETLYVSDFSKYAPVPVPAALWLFGSGLLSLIGVARRKKAA